MQSSKSKTLSDLVILRKLEKKESAGKFTNSIKRVTKKPADPDDDNPKYSNTWYLKNIGCEEDAMKEAIAQELMRLILPRQPKTRLVANEKGEFSCLISKEISGGDFSSLQNKPFTELNLNFSKGLYKGLGEILVLSLFINEVDLKLGNLFINDQEELIKIDGDNCFYANMQSTITTADIDNLPFIKDYQAKNWFDLIELSNEDKSDINKKSRIFYPGIIYNSQLRNEINRTIMKVISLPAGLLDDFVKSCLPPYREFPELFTEILNRQTQLKQAALGSRSFRRYMLAPEANTQFDEFMHDLHEFRTKGKNTLGMKKYDRIMRKNMTELSSVIAKEDLRGNRNYSANNFFKPPVKKEEVQASDRNQSLWEKVTNFFF